MILTGNEKRIDPGQIILPNFHNYWSYSNQNYFTHFVLKGGRNSAKSTSIACKFIEDLATKPINCLGVRLVGNTIRESMVEQMKEASELMGMDHLFHFPTGSSGTLRVTYLPRGNFMLFRGADKPKKFKSIKTANFPITKVWFEEVDEFKTEDDLQIIIDSILRAELPEGHKYQFHYSYNPPRRKQHWLNKKYNSVIIPANTYVHHSTYENNYYLGPQTLDEINELKERNIPKYEWRYLGYPMGGGVVPFSNLVFRTITDEEFNTFDNFRQGVDWGYSIHEYAFVKWHYDQTRRTIYAVDEIFGLQLSNRKTGAEIIKRGYHTKLMTCDSAEPKSIKEYRYMGINAKKAVKGPGSIEYGEKWLDDLEAIVIDPKRTPGMAFEFENIDYEQDADGNPTDKLEDIHNNTIDATRYAFEKDMKINSVTFI